MNGGKAEIAREPSILNTMGEKLSGLESDGQMKN